MLNFLYGKKTFADYKRWEELYIILGLNSIFVCSEDSSFLVTKNAIFCAVEINSCSFNFYKLSFSLKYLSSSKPSIKSFVPVAGQSNHKKVTS